MALKRVEFFYDIVSPYSLLAFQVLRRYAPVWGKDPSTVLQLRPVFLGGVMAATGNKPPASNPAKGRYMAQDLSRAAHMFKCPVSLPPIFPSNTITAMRILTLLQSEAPQHVEGVTASMWHAYWQAGEDIQNAEVLASAIVKGANVDADTAAKWVEGASLPEVKAALKAATEEAVERGMFGAPTMFVTSVGEDDDAAPHMFFGSDRFATIAHMFDLPWYGPAGPPSSKL